MRIYLEKYSKENTGMETAEALADIAKAALEYSDINAISGREGPTVIT